MKEYPSIQSWPGTGGVSVYVFDKLDGSNCRAEVNKKGEISKFGKRNGLLDDQTPYLNEARIIIPNKYGDLLGRMVRDQRWDMATFYFEFVGPQSFAGWHAAEPHDCVLFDIAPHKKGFLEPKEFLKLCGDTVDHVRLLHQGNFTKDIADAVTNSTLENMTFEGIVAKGALDRKTGLNFSFKWKSLLWLKKLKERCGDNEKLYEQLA